MRFRLVDLAGQTSARIPLYLTAWMLVRSFAVDLYQALEELGFEELGFEEPRVPAEIKYKEPAIAVQSVPVLWFVPGMRLAFSTTCTRTLTRFKSIAFDLAQKTPLEAAGGGEEANARDPLDRCQIKCICGLSFLNWARNANLPFDFAVCGTALRMCRTQYELYYSTSCTTVLTVLERRVLAVVLVLPAYMFRYRPRTSLGTRAHSRDPVSTVRARSRDAKLLLRLRRLAVLEQVRASDNGGSHRMGVCTEWGFAKKGDFKRMRVHIEWGFAERGFAERGCTERAFAKNGGLQRMGVCLTGVSQNGALLSGISHRSRQSRGVCAEEGLP
eukprot:3137895-Rhodomonas_salina.1